MKKLLSCSLALMALLATDSALAQQRKPVHRPARGAPQQPMPNLQEPRVNYSYAEALYSSGYFGGSDFRIESEEGFRVGASYPFFGPMFAFASYSYQAYEQQDLEVDGDLEEANLGLGAHIETGPVSFFGRASYETRDAKDEVEDQTTESDGYGLESGVAAALPGGAELQLSYKFSRLEPDDSEGDLDIDALRLFGVLPLTPWIGVVAGAEIRDFKSSLDTPSGPVEIESDEERYFLGIRARLPSNWR